MSTMLRLTGQQRTMLAEKVLDGANLAAGAMIFGQFVADRHFSFRVAILGLAIWLFFVFCAIRLSKEQTS